MHEALSVDTFLPYMHDEVMTAIDSADSVRMHHILEQIGDTARRSDDLFARSIRDLLGAVLMSSLRGVESASRVLVDIMDRNLYERANDCRWWALAPELCMLLADGTPGWQQAIERILRQLNGLYTVYSSIFVYGRDGTVIAASTGDAFPNVDADAGKRCRATIRAGLPRIGHSRRRRTTTATRRTCATPPYATLTTMARLSAALG